MIALFASAGMLIASSASSAEDYEWQRDEGVHEEEWYDPSDWFDDDFDGRTTNIDRESDDWDYDIDYSYDENNWSRAYGANDRGHSWTNSNNDYFDAYYDGYYDGFHDDEFGQEQWSNDRDPDYSSAYTDGYYDGYYDQMNDYQYEPMYYVTTYHVDRQRNTERERAEDENRKRGDRVTKTEDGRDPMMRRSGMVRRRGTVDDWSTKSLEGVSKEHLVLAIKFEDGDEVVADFGPKMTKQRLPFDEGDRITLRGNKADRDGKTCLIVQRINSDDQQIELRSHRSSRDAQQQARADQRNRSRYDRTMDDWSRPRQNESFRADTRDWRRNSDADQRNRSRYDRTMDDWSRPRQNESFRADTRDWRRNSDADQRNRSRYDRTMDDWSRPRHNESFRADTRDWRRNSDADQRNRSRYDRTMDDWSRPRHNESFRADTRDWRRNSDSDASASQEDHDQRQARRDRSSRDYSDRDRANRNERQQVRIDGKVKQVDKTRDSVQNHVLYRVQMQGGKSYTLAFEQPMASKKLNRVKGERISITGHRIKLDGQRVVKVTNASIDGEQLRLSSR